MNGSKILITGGIKSGKSRYALELAQSFPGEKIFIATAEAFDDEMKQKITKHKKERSTDFVLKEEPLFLSKALNDVQSQDIVLIDCLTVWLNNLYYHFSNDTAKIMEQLELFIDALKFSNQTIIMVTNEIGTGGISANELTRNFVSQLGLLNQRIGKLSDELIWMVAGHAQQLKGSYQNADKK